MRKAAIWFVVAGCLAMTACSSSGGDGQPTTSTSGEHPINSGAAQPITVHGVRGDVSLDKPATRVVALEWTYVEDLQILGVTPVGVADIKGYSSYVTATDPLPDGVTDVGTRQEPNLEAIAALKPDLIIDDTFRMASNYDALSGIAPVLAFDPYSKDATQLETMKNDFTEVAKAVGKQDEAQQQLAALDQAGQDAKAALDKAGLTDLSAAVAVAGSSPGAAPAVRMFTDRTLVQEVLGLAGIKTGWQGKPDDYGNTTVSPEALTKMPADAYFLYAEQPDYKLFSKILPTSSVWKNLPFVMAGHIKALDPGTWFYGGPKSCIQILTETVKALGA
jgi:iron complex transport system substrate-binding protein